MSLATILDDLKNGVVCMACFFLNLISNSSNLFSNVLGTAPSASTTNSITVARMFRRFLARLQNPNICLPFLFFIFSLYFFKEQNLLLDRLFFHDYLHWFWSSLRVGVIRLYLEIPENFMGLIHREQILVCAYIFCQHGQILIAWTIPSGSSFSTNHA